MLGAILGDVVGSVYKKDNIDSKDFPLFSEESHFTGDTVMTVATADALMKGGESDNFIDAYKKWGRLYPDLGYEEEFYNWILSESREPIDAQGNGPAARVSPCGWVKNGREKAKISAEVTHKDLESVNGAIAVVDTIMMCYFNRGTNDKMFRTLMKEHVEKGYGYKVNTSSDDVVSQAIAIFLQSTDFEDALRNAVCVGKGNSTLVTITGSIAEIAYGIPDWIEDEALEYLDIELLHVVNQWRQFIP